MANYDVVYDWVVPDVPVAPLPVVYHAIRDSVISFCQQTLLYKQELQQILVLAPVSTTTTAAASSGAASVVVASIANFSDGDTILITLEDGTKWRGKVSGTPAALTINLDGTLNDDVESGAAVEKITYLYTMTMPTGTAFAKALNAWLNDKPIDPISQDDLDSEFNNNSFNWMGVNWRTDVKLPTRFYTVNDNTIGLVMTPASGSMALRVNAALKPTRASTTFPDWIYERYVEVIAHGAKGRLMSSPKKPYTDLKLASFHMKEFANGVSDARQRTARAATKAPLRTHTVFGLR